jgi:hypothetical protein
MNRCMPLLAILISTHIALCGATAMTAAYTEDAAQISIAGGVEAQHQGGNHDGGSSANSGVDATPVGKSGSDGVDDAWVETRGNAKYNGNAATGDTGGSNAGDRHAGSRGGAGEEETNGKDVAHGDSQAGTKHSGTEFAPIDTRITMVGSRRSWRWSTALDWKKSKVVRPSGNLRYGRNSMRGSKGGVLRNAIGLAVDVKIPAVNDVPNSAQPAGNGERQAGRTDFHREGFAPVQVGVVRPHDSQINTAMNHSIVNGRDLVRPGSRSGAIGGAAKNDAGVIDGTSFRPRHP